MTSRSPDGTDGAPRKGPPPSAAVAQAIDALEQEMGGREALRAALAAIDGGSPELSYVVGLIADPAADRTSLSALCHAGGVSVAELLTAFKTGVMARATVQAIQMVAARMPAVVADVMRRAAPYEDPCYTCQGATTVAGEGDDAAPVICPTCQGHGTLTYTPDLDRQKLALSLTPFATKGGPAVVLNQIDARSVNVTDSSPSGLARLLSATDAILHQRRAPRVAPVDVDMTPGVDPA